MQVTISFPGTDRPAEQFDSWDALNARIQELKADDSVTEIALDRGDVVCDLCVHPAVRWLYQIVPGGALYTISTEGGSEHHIDHDGKWGACDECRRLISERDWKALAERAYVVGIEQNPGMAGLPREIMTEVYAEGGQRVFREGWEAAGCPDPVTVEESSGC
jgi:hypothetical protein